MAAKMAACIWVYATWVQSAKLNKVTLFIHNFRRSGSTRMQFAWSGQWSPCRSVGGVAFLIRPSRRFETLPVYPPFLRRRHSINWSNCPRWSTLCATRPFAALLKLFSVLKSHFRSKARYYRGYQRHNRPPLIYCIRWYFMPLPQYSESH